MNITTGKKQTPMRAVIYGPEGIGKTTLAAAFPKPLFIDTEHGTAHLDVSRADKATSWSMLRSQLSELAKDPHGFETIVIDTADWTERMIAQHVCDANDKESLADFGFGKGNVKLAEEFGKFVDILNELFERGLNVVVVAHSMLRKFEQPDEAGSYDRWELKLDKKTSPLLKEWGDLVLFVNYRTIVVDVEGKKKAQGGERVMYTTHTPSWDAKNRFGMDPQLALSYDAIAPHVLAHTPVVTPAAPPADDLDMGAATRPAPVPAAVTATPVVAVTAPAPTAFHAALYDLMEQDTVSAEDIQWAVGFRGYLPADMLVDNYPEEFVQNCLIPGWEKVKSLIANRSTEGQA